MTAPQAPAAAEAEHAPARAGGAAAFNPVEQSYAEHGSNADSMPELAGVSLPCFQPITIVDELSGQSMQVRCGTRRKAACLSCAALYAGDAKQILRSGVLDAEPGTAVVMLTLTAPSFGKIHRASDTQPSPRWDILAQKSYAVRAAKSRCPCGERHNADDVQVGTAIDPSRYDFQGQAAWNASTGKLWNRTATKIRRRLGLAERLQYAGVSEFQARGAVHFHMLLRLPVSVLGSVGIQRDRLGRLRAREIEAAVAESSTTVDGQTFSWGSQMTAEVIAGPGLDDSRYARRSIGYLIKALGYTVKDIGGQEPGPSLHHRRAHAAARRMACRVCERDGRTVTSLGCRSPRHRSLGYAGWPVRRSRDWSPLTFTALRQRRCDYNGGTDKSDTPECRWRFVTQQRDHRVDSLAVALENFGERAATEP